MQFLCDCADGNSEAVLCGVHKVDMDMLRLGTLLAIRSGHITLALKCLENCTRDMFFDYTLLSLGNDAIVDYLVNHPHDYVLRQSGGAHKNIYYETLSQLAAAARKRGRGGQLSIDKVRSGGLEGGEGDIVIEDEGEDLGEPPRKRVKGPRRSTRQKKKREARKRVDPTPGKSKKRDRVRWPDWKRGKLVRQKKPGVAPIRKKRKKKTVVKPTSYPVLRILEYVNKTGQFPPMKIPDEHKSFPHIDTVLYSQGQNTLKFIHKGEELLTLYVSDDPNEDTSVYRKGTRKAYLASINSFQDVCHMKNMTVTVRFVKMVDKIRGLQVGIREIVNNAILNSQIIRPHFNTSMMFMANQYVTDEHGDPTPVLISIARRMDMTLLDFFGIHMARRWWFVEKHVSDIVTKKRMRGKFLKEVVGIYLQILCAMTYTYQYLRHSHMNINLLNIMISFPTYGKERTIIYKNVRHSVNEVLNFRVGADTNPYIVVIRDTKAMSSFSLRNMSEFAYNPNPPNFPITVDRIPPFNTKMNSVHEARFYARSRLSTSYAKSYTNPNTFLSIPNEAYEPIFKHVAPGDPFYRNTIQPPQIMDIATMFSIRFYRWGQSFKNILHVLNHIISENFTNKDIYDQEGKERLEKFEALLHSIGSRATTTEDGLPSTPQHLTTAYILGHPLFNEFRINPGFPMQGADRLFNFPAWTPSLSNSITLSVIRSLAENIDPVHISNPLKTLEVGVRNFEDVDVDVKKYIGFVPGVDCFSDSPQDTFHRVNRCIHAYSPEDIDRLCVQSDQVFEGPIFRSMSKYIISPFL